LLFDPAWSLDDQGSCSKKTSPYVHSLGSGTPQTIHQSGNITWVTSQNFPILKGLSLRRLMLAVNGVREPHWHLNANELSYCLVSANNI
jgi:oxalate decarboxylase